MLNIPLQNPDIRMGEELCQVLADSSCRCEGPVYEMYRDIVKNEEDRAWLSSHKIRFDITRIPGKIFCNEWVKTKGHYHPVAPDGQAYPEIYEVLEGNALYLLQKEDLSDCILVEAKEGDLVMIPPGYGHVTINPAPSVLTMANLVSSEFSSNYLPFEERQGAMFYIHSDGTISHNEKYPDQIQLRRYSATGRSLPKPFPQKGLYKVIGDEKAVDFLNHPAQYIDKFQEIYNLI